MTNAFNNQIPNQGQIPNQQIGGIFNGFNAMNPDDIFSSIGVTPQEKEIYMTVANKLNNLTANNPILLQQLLSRAIQMYGPQGN